MQKCRFHGIIAHYSFYRYSRAFIKSTMIKNLSSICCVCQVFYLLRLSGVLSAASVRRTWLNTTHTGERSFHTNLRNYLRVEFCGILCNFVNLYGRYVLCYESCLTIEVRYSSYHHRILFNISALNPLSFFVTTTLIRQTFVSRAIVFTAVSRFLKVSSVKH